MDFQIAVTSFRCGFDYNLTHAEVALGSGHFSDALTKQTHKGIRKMAAT